MTNVVDVYVNYLRRKVDAGYDPAHSNHPRHALSNRHRRTGCLAGRASWFHLQHAIPQARQKKRPRMWGAFFTF